MKRLIRTLARSLGYDIRKTGNFDLRVDASYVLKTYTRPDGSFDYARYKQIQIRGNHDKLGQSWVCEDTIATAARIIKSCVTPRFGLCHGTRQGLEQKWFKQFLQCEVIGTEISDTAAQFQDTIQWDFHEVKEEWIDNTDFIYSNSLDHSYDPRLCLERWIACLHKDGVCILDYSDHHDSPSTSELDPFGAPLQTLLFLITWWGKGDFFVTNIVEYRSKRGRCYFLIIRKHGYSMKVSLT